MYRLCSAFYESVERYYKFQGTPVVTLYMYNEFLSFIAHMYMQVLARRVCLSIHTYMAGIYTYVCVCVSGFCTFASLCVGSIVV